jgi:TonB family protein
MRTAFLHDAIFPLTACLLFTLLCVIPVVGQKPGGRERISPPTPSPTPRTVTTPSTRKPRDKVDKTPLPRASMTIIAPLGSRVWINELEIDTSQTAAGLLSLDGQSVKTSYAETTGTFTLKGLKPGVYRLSARKPDFREYATPAPVLLDQDNVFTIVLTPIPGKLTVSPSVAGADLEIFNLENEMSIGRYADHLDKFELSPGNYRIVASKTGYRMAVREIRVSPGESVYLEPVLESLPTPTPIPRRPALTAPMRLDVQRQDKYMIFRLQGSSGDLATTLGSINVTLGGPSRNYVNGNLNGQPCRIEFIKLENIAEAAIVEAPGPSNEWAAIVVRVRPKNEKRRPISFAINWSSLQRSSPASTANTNSTVLIPAQAIRKVQPVFPAATRGSPVSGTVLVLLSIDKEGSVVSAKAIQGPHVFRRVAEDAARNWRFRPATRDGRNVESEQTIQFRFEPQ